MVQHAHTSPHMTWIGYGMWAYMIIHPQCVWTWQRLVVQYAHTCFHMTKLRNSRDEWPSMLILPLKWPGLESEPTCPYTFQYGWTCLVGQHGHTHSLPIWPDLETACGPAYPFLPHVARFRYDMWANMQFTIHFEWDWKQNMGQHTDLHVTELKIVTWANTPHTSSLLSVAGLRVAWGPTCTYTTQCGLVQNKSIHLLRDWSKKQY